MSVQKELFWAEEKLNADDDFCLDCSVNDLGKFGFERANQLTK